MKGALMAEVAAMQDSDGCFPSEVTGPEGTREDRNGFTTALALRALRNLPESRALDRVRSAALKFLSACRSLRKPMAFQFWPEEGRPDWAPRLPPDIDDTAVMTTELFRYGRITLRDALRAICLTLLPCRIRGNGETRPPWAASGAFPTWIGGSSRPNIVDCCVNANVAALMSLTGVTHVPGFEEAVRSVRDGVDWAGGDPRRLRSLSPFYPSPESLREAVEHAVECGTASLSSTLRRLRQLPEQQPGWQALCCCSAYGGTIWRCRGLEKARVLRELALSGNELVSSGKHLGDRAGRGRRVSRADHR